MPASRWQTSFRDLLQWNDDEENELISMMIPSMFSKALKSDSSSNNTDAEKSENTPKYPAILPILPLRGVVVYPQTAVPLTVGQPRSVKLVDDVVGGDKLVGLVASTNAELESPGPQDLYKVGTIAIVHRLLRAPDGTYLFMFRAMNAYVMANFSKKKHT